MFTQGSRLRRSSTLVRQLYALARLSGIQVTYRDLSRRTHEASPDTLLAVLRALGTPLEHLKDVPQALEMRRQALWQQPIEPVIIAWDGLPEPLTVRLPVDEAEGEIALEVLCEDGSLRRWTCDLSTVRRRVRAMMVGRKRYLCKQIPWPENLPWGYHQLTVSLQRRSCTSGVICAPRQAFVSGGNGEQEKSWGVFVPLYALHSQNSWGLGDLSDLRVLGDWVRRQGGDFVSILPLLAAFLDEPFEPSPYVPVSRLFWNELYLDVTRVPELAQCPSAQRLVASVDFQQTLTRLRQQRLVDYRQAMACKRKVLQELSGNFDTLGSSQRHEAFRQFVNAHPSLEDYARFRAACEHSHHPWRQWPFPSREGEIDPATYERSTYHYHLYVQWLMHEQLMAITATVGTRDDHIRLALDLPLGVHSDGYDIWRQQTLFAPSVSTGAPTDIVFSNGQDWGFAPIHPQQSRKMGHAYFRACVRHHLQYASLLRIDHVMGLHRSFWIPHGFKATHGVYVTYPAEEFYAILTLESQRAGAIIAGEDLGTVPPEVHPAMDRHKIHRLFVVEYELAARAPSVLRVVPRDSIASINTHDMPPFAAFWQALDIAVRIRLGLLSASQASQERASRAAVARALVRFLARRGYLPKCPSSVDSRQAIGACTAHLASSPARVVLLNLDDLLGETEPQNIPGTVSEHPNWRLKLREPLERLMDLPEVCDGVRLLSRLSALRKL